MPKEYTYIGDGVYASFDGYQIWLSRDRHDNEVIALEKAVMIRLVDYANTVYFPKEKDDGIKTSR